MRLGTFLFALLLTAPVSSGYCILTHEAIIDTAWTDSIVPLLRKRFPNATREQLREAHAYAYGGAIIQDLGYYPFGSDFFSRLTHYVRPGDFVGKMLADARDINEFAFALGALAHEAADVEGHSIATNRAVATTYPKLRAKFGNSISYEDSPSAHLKVEFGFDVSQVAHQHYAPDAYRDFIGFEISRPVMERAFRDTYDIEFDSLFFSPDLAIGTYRYTVSKLLPLMTKVAWQSRRKEIDAEHPGMKRREFVYALSRASYRKQWGKQYKAPGPAAQFLAFLFRLLPKRGPLRWFEFHPMTPATEDLFARSFVAALQRYKTLLQQVSDGKTVALNLNLDTGEPLAAGRYHLADKAYAELIDRLASQKFAGVSPDLKGNIHAFYNAHPPVDGEKLAQQLQELDNETILGKEKANGPK